MCTLVQKEILIEEISEAMAFICYRQKYDAPLSTETIKLIGIREFIYKTNHKEIDLEKTRKEIEELKKSYLGKPRILLADLDYFFQQIFWRNYARARSR